MNPIKNIAYFAGILSLLGVSLAAQDASQLASQKAPQSPPKDLTQASLEDLMNVQVTSVSKKEEKLWTTGAAVFVLTQEDIRRSGYTNIPDLLRLVPGVNVARMNANVWAISIRGFNDVYANKVLVLVDGRSVYDPIFSGVSWQDLDVPLEDIERIEVIRGPGGTVWGANAMNGVINIITKNAENTRGALVRTGAGSSVAAGALAQYGGDIGSWGSYRVFQQYYNLDNFKTIGAGDALDGSHSFHEGFRADWRPTASDTLMVEGDYKQTTQGDLAASVVSNALPAQVLVDDIQHNAAGSVLALWKHTLAGGDEISVQMYESYANRGSIAGRYMENTVDFDFQDHMAAGRRNDIVWGAGLRLTDLKTIPGYSFSFSPPNRTDLLGSAFVQDEIRITDSLGFTAGSKFEHNGYTGFEFEPSGQLVWTPAAKQTLWASAARAIRQPNMVDTQILANVAIVPVPGVPFGVLQAQGVPNPKVETVNDYEAGYRVQIGKHLSFDAAGFASYFRNVRGATRTTPYLAFTPMAYYLVLPVKASYQDHVQTHGGEIFATWDVNSRWRLSPGYSLFHTHRSTFDPNEVIFQVLQTGLSSPQHRFEVRSMLSLPHHIDWDTNIGYTSSIMGGAIPAYTQLDSRIGWQYKGMEFSLNGQNLLRPSHLEFPNELTASETNVPRSVFAQISWRFLTSHASGR